MENNIKFPDSNSKSELKFPPKRKWEIFRTFWVETIPHTFRSIFYNKRRSFAMLAGMILASTLLSGIIIYNGELNRNNYLSMIKDQPYEVRFDIINNETNPALNELVTQIRADDRVLASSILAGQYGDFNANLNTQLFSPSHLAEPMPIGESVGVYFVDEDFSTNEIGATLASMDFKGEFDLSGDSVIISSQMARKLGLTIGQQIPLMNFTQMYSNEDGSVWFSVEGSLTNITIKGTYKMEEMSSFSLADIFRISPFQGDVVYLSLKLLEEKPSLENLEANMHQQGNFFVAVKLDISKFSVDDPTVLLEEIRAFTNDIAKNNPNDLQVLILIEMAIMGFQIISIFVTILYVLLSIPVIMLSIYLLNFGLEMSLEERRRGIAIRKVQGADSSQIFGELRNETLFLLIGGVIIGYFAGILSAWLISSATGYMKMSIEPETFMNFLHFDLTAFLVPLIFTGLLTVVQIYKKGRQFILSEVTEGIVKREDKKISFLRRTNIDIVFFFVGFIGLTLSILQRFKVALPISDLALVGIYFFTPFLFWIGGSSVGSRLTKAIPLKLEGSFLNLKVFKDVKRIIKSGLKRRGDVDRLSVIIILTLSIAALATIQGTTEELHARRDLEWQVGADWQINFEKMGNYRTQLGNVASFDGVVALTESNIKILSGELPVISIQNSEELARLKAGNPVLLWQEDNFDHFTAQQALQTLEDAPRGIFIPSDYISYMGVSIGEKIEIKVMVEGSTTGALSKIENIEILGTINQFPGSVIYTCLTSEILMREIYALSKNLTKDALKDAPLNATKYFASTKAGPEITSADIEATQIALEGIAGISSERSFYDELNRLNTAEKGYGISGLLSLDFIISLLASLISAFAFSAIIMEKRKHEFAILRSIGAKKKHIYKLALGENALMMLTASLWGILLGIGIAQLFNGVFTFVSMISGTFSELERLVVVPLYQLLAISAVTFFGMLGATVVSIHSAANQDIAIGIKEE